MFVKICEIKKNGLNTKNIDLNLEFPTALN